MKHTRALVEMYQRLVPDTSQTLQAIAARCLNEIEEAEMQAARIAELEKEMKVLRAKLWEAYGVLGEISAGIINIPPDKSYGDWDQRRMTSLEDARKHAKDFNERVARPAIKDLKL